MMSSTTRYSEAEIQKAGSALTALSAELFEDQEALTEYPLAFVNRIHALGQAHPSIQTDLNEIMIGLKSKSISIATPTESDNECKIGLYTIKKFAKELEDSIAPSELKAIEEFIDSNVDYEASIPALDNLIQNADVYKKNPLAFAQQIQSLRSIGHILTSSQENEILGILLDRTFPALSKEEPTLIPESKMEALRLIAREIRGSNSIIVRAEVERNLFEEMGEWDDLSGSEPVMRTYQILDIVREKIFYSHQKYKSLLVEAMSPAERASIEDKKSIPIPVLSADIFTDQLVPEGEALIPINPSDIPPQFESDLLKEETTDGLTSTRGRNKTFRFHQSSAAEPYVVASPKTRQEGEKIIREAERFAKQIMPSDATSDDINRMRNHILAFSSQHLPNGFVMPFVIEATQFLGANGTEASFSIAKDTVQFFPVMKQGVVQPGQFKVVLESRVVMKTLIDTLPKSQNTLVTDLCMAAPAVVKVNAELTFKMEKKEGETTWTPSISSITKTYNLEKAISF